MKIKYFLLLIFTTSVCYSGQQWCNYVNYDIDVKLDDQQHMLSGEQRIVYYNHSPDTLNRIWLLLYPNAYRNVQTQFARQLRRNGRTDFHFSNPLDWGYIDIISVTLNQEKVELKAPSDSIDVGYIDLKHPLLPRDSLIMRLTWKVKIPHMFSRFGHRGQHYEISQWFPKVPVYDQAGWHPYSYLEMGEYYYEFGDYQVSICLPRDYVVGATGELVAPDSEIEWMDSLARRGEMESQLADPKSLSLPKTDSEAQAETAHPEKTLHFKAHKVVDFAWVADKRYHVNRGYYRYPDQADSITIWNLFFPEHMEQWHNTVETVEKTLEFYGDLCGFYPYPTVWVAESKSHTGSGMEYPMLTTVTPTGKREHNATIIAHEVGHNWFYGILGFNERRYPWMDEGINSWADNRFEEQYIPGLGQLLGNSRSELIKRLVIPYITRAHRNLPSDRSAQYYPFMDYFVNIYIKPVQGLELMAKYVGYDQFKQAMRDFYTEWQFLHPQPVDMRLSFEKTLGMDLSWFFQDFLGSLQLVDYTLTDYQVEMQNGKYHTQIVIENLGDISLPVNICLYDQADSLLTEKWILPESNSQLVSLTTSKAPDRAVIDPGFLTWDANYLNNSSDFPLSVKLLPAFPRPDKWDILCLPYPDYNYSDGFQTGLAVVHYTLPPTNHNFYYTVNYGWKSQHVITLFQYRNTLYDWSDNQLTYGFNVAHTTNRKHYRLMGKVEQEPRRWPDYKHTYQLDLQYLDLLPTARLDQTYWTRDVFKYLNLSWKYTRKRFLWNYTHHFRLTLGHQNRAARKGGDFGKLELSNYLRCQLGRESWIKTRIAGGSFIYKCSPLPRQEYFHANGGLDPYFNNYFVYDRTGSNWYAPMQNWYISDGINLKGYPGYKGNAWYLGMNLEYQLKSALLFFDIGDVVNQGQPYRPRWDSGLGLRIGPLNIYLPLYISRPVDQYPEFSNLAALKHRWLLEISLTDLTFKISG